MTSRQLAIRDLGNVQIGSPMALEWNQLVAANQASGFMQSLEWAKFKIEQGLTCIHLGIFEGNKLVGGSLCYFMASDSGASFLVAPEGPVIPWQEEELALACLNLIISYCETLAKKPDPGIIGLRIEPRLPLPLPHILLEFGRAPMDLVPRETLYLDLTGSADQILATMKPKGRYNIRLAERKGVLVRQGSAADMIDLFYPILSQTGRRDHFSVEPLSFFVEMASTLMPTGRFKMLLAEHEGEVLGGLIMVTFGNMATYLYGGTSNTKRNFMVGYALQWAAIKMAKEAGCRTYDLYGFDRFRSPDNRYGRFSKFKSQFGGQVIHFIGAQDYYFMDQLADTLIRAFREVES